VLLETVAERAKSPWNCTRAFIPPPFLMTQHPVHQARHRPHPRRMALAEVPIRVRQRLIPPQPPDPLFYYDAPPTERLVVTPVRQRPPLSPRLAPAGRPQPFGMQVRDPHIRQVAQPAHAPG